MKQRDKTLIVNLFDGELVDDSNWRRKNTGKIYLVFDALIVNTENVMHLNFQRRLEKADQYIKQRFLPARSLDTGPQ